MRPPSRLATVAACAVAITSLAASNVAGAQSNCAPANRASVPAVSTEENLLSRRVSLHGRAVSLRDALDRLAAAARIRVSYSAELLELSRPVCLEYESVPVSRVLDDLLADAPVRPVVLGSDQIVLTPAATQTAAVETAPILKSVSMLDRVVVTGSTIGASQRALPIALDVVGGKQLSE